MSKFQEAVARFEKFNCAQSVFASFGPDHGLSEQVCLTVAGPFGAGMGRMGETCGVVNGALMVLGVRDGQGMATDPAQARGPLYERVQEFVDEFRQRHGALTCRELTGCNMLTFEGQAEYKARDLQKTLCQKLIASAVELLEER